MSYCLWWHYGSSRFTQRIVLRSISGSNTYMVAELIGLWSKDYRFSWWTNTVFVEQASAMAAPITENRTRELILEGIASSQNITKIEEVVKPKVDSIEERLRVMEAQMNTYLKQV